ncbi:hypothetical protein [Crenothrix sp.]|uniref:hypothetical protein n=1 Tax=Crenothrix sp. TaxID=3100433 RepID=UPI00374D3F39
MKHNLLLTALIVSFGVSQTSVASPLCDKLKIPASQLSAFSPKDAQGKSVHNSMNDAVACLNADWAKLSRKLTYRGSTSDASFVTPAPSPAPTVVVSYAPAATYNATIATPVAFLTRPVVNVNYLPMTHYSSTQIMTHTYRLNAPHLADEVPTSNYQGSLPTPIIYQTGHWNVDR